jgi:hypothetical protein
MKRVLFVNLMWIFIMLIFHVSFNVNWTYGEDLEMEMYYKKLSSEKFEARNEAVNYFYELINEESDEKYMQALIDLFKREVEQIKKFKDFLQKGGTADTLPKEIAYRNSREIGLYQLYLCRLVSKSGDKTLLNVVLTNCGDPESISSFGEDAVEPVINALRKPGNPGGRITGIQVLGEILRLKEAGYIASGETRNRIKEVLENIANNDPYFWENKDKNTGKIERVYPVRMTAKEVLEKLKASDK